LPAGVGQATIAGKPHNVPTRRILDVGGMANGNFQRKALYEQDDSVCKRMPGVRGGDGPAHHARFGAAGQ